MKTRLSRALALALTVVSWGCQRESAPPATPAAPATTPAAPAGSATLAAPAAPKAEPATPPPAASPATSPVEAVAVTSATLGNAINADKRVTAATDTFRPQDTIYVSVETSGTGGASLTARWTYRPEGQATRVNEETQKVPAGGPSITEFHIRKPDGWPAGDYQVVVLVDGEAAVTRRFGVK